ncbi:MAG: DHHA1 domain-containing protein, partial [Chthoniobacterales bacterium]|nr:DHHA1 domain-containing protein [Chthoniobacterales bacterium]
LLCQVSEEYQGKLSAGKLVSEASREVGGRGGGRADFARGGGSDVSRAKKALEVVRSLILKAL